MPSRRQIRPAPPALPPEGVPSGRVPGVHLFSLLEMLIVSAIVAMLFLAVLPRMSAVPRRLVVEKACSDIGRAFQETALQARTSGRARTLALAPGGESCFTVSDHAQDLSHQWRIPDRPPTPDDDGGGDGPSPRKSPAAPPKDTRFPFSSEIVWDTDDLKSDDDPEIRFTFFPDGQAAGPDLRFEIKGRKFTIVLNHVTGRIRLTENPDD